MSFRKKLSEFLGFALKKFGRLDDDLCEQMSIGIDVIEHITIDMETSLKQSFLANVNGHIPQLFKGDISQILSDKKKIEGVDKEDEKLANNLFATIRNIWPKIQDVDKRTIIMHLISIVIAAANELKDKETLDIIKKMM